MMEEINANTPIKHETINRKSNRFSRSTNQDVNNSYEEDRRNTSDLSSRSSGEKDPQDISLNSSNQSGKFNAFKKQREEQDRKPVKMKDLLRE